MKKKGQPKQTETKAQAKIDNDGKMKKGARVMRHLDKERQANPAGLQEESIADTLCPLSHCREL